MRFELKHLEAKHKPIINITDDKVYITIWFEVHPMQDEHNITHIDVLKMTKDGVTSIKSFELHENQEPKVDLDINELEPGNVYKVQARCNQHGTWDNEFFV